jgi:hypothetical protein
MARKLTVVVDDDTSHEQYANLGNAFWATMKAVRPGGDFHLQADGGTPVDFLNAQYDKHGEQIRWK